MSDNNILPGVMVVDDEELIRRSLARSLKSQYTIYTASSAEEALMLISGGIKVDLVVSDYNMGGIDGLAFYDRLLVMSMSPPLFLLMSGSSASPELFAGARQRGLEILLKPFGSRMLESKLAELLAA